VHKPVGQMKNVVVSWILAAFGAGFAIVMIYPGLAMK